MWWSFYKTCLHSVSIIQLSTLQSRALPLDHKRSWQAVKDSRHHLHKYLKSFCGALRIEFIYGRSCGFLTLLLYPCFNCRPTAPFIVVLLKNYTNKLYLCYSWSLNNKVIVFLFKILPHQAISVLFVVIINCRSDDNGAGRFSRTLQKKGDQESVVLFMAAAMSHIMATLCIRCLVRYQVVRSYSVLCKRAGFPSLGKKGNLI